MPIVPQSPTQRSNVVPLARPSETDLAIALATVHEQGRLFPPKDDLDPREITPDQLLANKGISASRKQGDAIDYDAAQIATRRTYPKEQKKFPSFLTEQDI